MVVGASLAGMTAAQSMRWSGHQGELVVVGAERHLPYDRPPLSKGYLTGAVDEARLTLRSATEALGITWWLGRRAERLDPSSAGGGVLTLDDGSVLEADGIVLATGARARALPGSGDLAGVGTLRSRNDADGLRDALASGPGRMVVIGFGFIGAEVAATARTAGWEVALVEAAPQPMARVLGSDAGMAVAELHRSHGVEVHLGTMVDHLVATGGRVSGVALSGGQVIECSQVVVGIGAVPETEWLRSSGLGLGDGVIADETLLVAPGVVAAGDVARWPHPRLGGSTIRLEQWDNAVEMGGYAGKRLLAWAVAEPVEPFGPVPWFWSDQYDRKMQLAGVATDRTEIVQGSFEEQRVVQLQLDESGAVAGAFCWNRPRQAIMARQLIAEDVDLETARGRLG